MKDQLIVGLDIGSSWLRLAIGQLAHTDAGHMDLKLIGAVETPSKGISKGVITSLEDAVASISQVLEAGEQQIGMPIEEAVVGIGGTHMTIMKAKGVIGVSRADGDIKAEDVERVMESARSMANPANHEILHVLSHDFTVDGQGGVKDPVGMHGIRLEADTHLILGLAGNVRNMTKGVFRTGLDIAALVFAPLAGAEVVTNMRERELGVVVANIGASTTSVLVFEEGQLIHAKVLPIGADHITSDIAIGLRTTLSTAERIKLEVGSALPAHVDPHGEIVLSDLGDDSNEVVSLPYVAEIIEARVEEIFEHIEEELESIERSGLLPAGIVITGGGAKLPGMPEIAKRMLKLPASVGAATSLETPIPECIHDPSYANAAGLVAWGFEELKSGTDHKKSGLLKQSGGVMGKMQQQVKRIFKSFIP